MDLFLTRSYSTRSNSSKGKSAIFERESKIGCERLLSGAHPRARPSSAGAEGGPLAAQPQTPRSLSPLTVPRQVAAAAPPRRPGAKGGHARQRELGRRAARAAREASQVAHGRPGGAAGRRQDAGAQQLGRGARELRELRRLGLARRPWPGAQPPMDSLGTTARARNGTATIPHVAPAS